MVAGLTIKGASATSCALNTIDDAIYTDQDRISIPLARWTVDSEGTEDNDFDDLYRNIMIAMGTTRTAISPMTNLLL